MINEEVLKKKDELEAKGLKIRSLSAKGLVLDVKVE